MPTPRVWFLNPFDPMLDSGLPTMRYGSFAKAFVKAGWEVVWLTADFDHFTRRYRVNPEIDRVILNSGLRIEYIHVPPYRATFGLPRIWSHINYTNGIRHRMNAFQAEKPDVIIVSLPLLNAVRAALVYRKFIGCKVVVDVQDLWPEALGSALPPIFRKMFYPLQRRLIKYEQLCLSASDGIIAVSETYLLKRGKNGLPMLVAYLGVDLEGFDAAMEAAGINLAARPMMIKGGLNFLWSGSIRPGVDLKTVLRAAYIVRARGDPARFIIAGDGPGRKKLEKFANDLGLGKEVVRFSGAYNLSTLSNIVNKSHVGLNAYPPDCSNSITNKLFEYQAARLAIINSIPGEVAELVDSNGMGVNYKSGDPESLANAISTFTSDYISVGMMGRAARKFVENYGSRAKIGAQVEKFLRELLL